MTLAAPPRLGAFVPRPIYRIKPYGVVVRKDDTASGIAQRFGLPPEAYRELVAANVFQRTLTPMALGCPCASRTLGDLQENEILAIPGHWPDVEGQPASLGDVQLDPVAQGIALAMQSIIGAGGGPAGPLPSGAEAAAMNAAIQWWYNTRGTAAPASPVEYVPYVTSALDWAVKALPAATGAGATPAQVATFPWGPFLASLPAIPDLTKVDWSNGTIPGTPGVPWTSIPWGWLSTLGTSVETLKLPPIAWPTPPTPEAVLAAIQAAVLAAMWTPGENCGQHATIGADHLCYCDDGYAWGSTDPTVTDCVAIAAPAPPPDGKTCPEGQVLVNGQCMGTGARVEPEVRCPKDTVPDGKGGCVAAAAPPTNAISTGMSTGVIAAAALGALALGAGAVFLITREDEKQPRASNPAKVHEIHANTIGLGVKELHRKRQDMMEKNQWRWVGGHVKLAKELVIVVNGARYTAVHEAMSDTYYVRDSSGALVGEYSPGGRKR